MGIVPKKSILPDFLTETALYGLGTARPIEAFWKKAGINPVTKKIESACRGSLKKR